MTYLQVSSIDLIVVALCTFAAAWRWPTIRPIGALILLAACITPFTSLLEVEEKGLIYLPLDLIGGIVGGIAFIRHRDTAGLAFLVFALLSCIAHLAMFSHPPHTKDQHFMYVLTLNVLFIASCLYVGGSGLARSHRHLWQRPGDSHSLVPSRSGG